MNQARLNLDYFRECIFVGDCELSAFSLVLAVSPHPDVVYLGTPEDQDETLVLV